MLPGQQLACVSSPRDHHLASRRREARERVKQKLRLATLTPSSFIVGTTICRSIVEEGEIAYGKHVQKEGEVAVPTKLLDKFLKAQNGADIRGVVLDGVLLVVGRIMH